MISQYFTDAMMPESSNPVQQPQTIIEIRHLEGANKHGISVRIIQIRPDAEPFRSQVSRIRQIYCPLRYVVARF